MNLRNIDLNLFIVFDAIYKEGGIRSASKRLHLSQSAVSHALARLRELLNDPLFERHGNEVVPTPLARAVATTIGVSLESLEQVLHRASQFNASTSKRTFTIGVRDSQEAHFLPHIYDIIQREAPGIHIAAVRFDRRDLESDLQTGKFDCAVDMEITLSEAVCRAQLDTDPQVVLVRRDHPAIHEVLGLDTYLAQEHVLVSVRRRGVGYADIALNRLGMSRQIRVRCQQQSVANQLVSQSNLLLTMLRKDAESVNQQWGNKIFPFPIEIPALRIFLYWHTNVNEDPGGKWFRDCVLSVFRDAAQYGRSTIPVSDFHSTECPLSENNIGCS